MSFHKDTVNHHSVTDYFICSSDLVLPKCDTMILDDGDNLSDHAAIMSNFSLSDAIANGIDCSESKSDSKYKLQWEKADIGFYQSYLNDQLRTIVIPVHALLCNNVYCHNRCIDLERYYNDIISRLTVAADKCISSVTRRRSESAYIRQVLVKFEARLFNRF